MTAAAWSPLLHLRPASPSPAPCKVCQAPAPLIGAVDFGRSCRDGLGRVDPVTGQAVYYRRCTGCGLIYTDAFDDWTPEDFAREIYNDGYLAVDPDYVERRPQASVAFVKSLFGAHAGQFSILDYGAGNGAFSALLEAEGFGEVAAYDPIVPDLGPRPDRRFDMVTCFETLEHVPDPRAAIADLASLTAEGGMVVFSTVVQPPDIDALGLDWWYLGPRNGHITLYSEAALQRLWGAHGLTFGSFNQAFHIAFRELPWFADALSRREAASVFEENSIR